MKTVLSSQWRKQMQLFHSLSLSPGRLSFAGIQVLSAPDRHPDRAWQRWPESLHPCGPSWAREGKRTQEMLIFTKEMLNDNQTSVFFYPFRSCRSSSKFNFPPAWRTQSVMSSTAVFFSLSFIKALLHPWKNQRGPISHIRASVYFLNDAERHWKREVDPPFVTFSEIWQFSTFLMKSVISISDRCCDMSAFTSE